MKSVVLASAAFVAVGAHAQADDDRRLPTVVVTPLAGVAQSEFDAPASVDVIDGSVLRNGQLQVNLSEALVRVPGVVALNRQNYAQDLQISIRGYGARSTFGVRGLRLYTDGIPATAPDGQGQISHFDLGSADRIEVLRGPFSALYGNSSGGVISLTTGEGAPGVQAEAATAFGSDGVRRHQLRIAGAQGEWNWVASALRFETDSDRDHSAAERNGFNGKLRWQPGPDTKVSLVLNSVVMPDVQDPLGLTRAELDANPRQASPAALQFDTRKSVSQQQGGIVLDQRLGDADALRFATWRGTRATTQYQAIPVATQAPATHPGGVIDLDRTYQGLDAQWIRRGQAAGGAWTLTGGLYADELAEARRGYQNFVGTTLGVQGALRRDEDNRVRSFDQYVQGQWNGAAVSVSLGLRHSRVRFRSEDHYIVTGNADDSGSASYAATTPAAGVVWHAREGLNLYVATGKGFETPTFNELAYRPSGQTGLNFDLRSANSRQWELGVKAQPAPGWKLNAAAFDARTRDEIVVLSNTGGRSTFQNAGATRRRGFEAALSGRWSTGVWFEGALTRLTATYASDFMTCVTAPCTTPNTLVPAGSRIPGVPRISAWAELGWRWRPWGLETAVEWRHIGSMAVDDRNTDFAPAASVWNLRLGWLQEVGRWTIREFVRADNVTDRRWVGSVIVNEGNRRFFEPAPGRTWLAGVSANYAF